MLILVGYLVGFLILRIIILPLVLVKTKILHVLLQNSVSFLNNYDCSYSGKYYTDNYLKGLSKKDDMDRADNVIKNIVLSNDGDSIFLLSIIYPLTFLALLIIFFGWFVFTKISKALTLLASYVERKISSIPIKKDKEIDQAKSSYRSISYKK